MSDIWKVGPMINPFGKNLRKLRLSARYGLREYSELIGMDNSNYSKYERGILKPPLDDTVLDRMLAPLNISATTKEEMKMLAALQRAPEEVTRMLDVQNDENAALTAKVERLREWQKEAVLVLEHWMRIAEFDLDELEVMMKEADEPRDYADDVHVHSESRELIARAKKYHAALEVDGE